MVEDENKLEGEKNRDYILKKEDVKIKIGCITKRVYNVKEGSEGVIVDGEIRVPYKSSFDERIANINRAISIFFILIPEVAMLYLYTFSMNTRKVAVYRGYLRFLEEKLSSYMRITLDYDNIDNGIVGRFVAGHFIEFKAGETFYTNTYGIIVLGISLLLLYFACFMLSWYFSNYLIERCYHKSIFSFMYKCLIMTMVICVLFSSIFVFDLFQNDKVSENVYKMCLEQDSIYIK